MRNVLKKKEGYFEKNVRWSQQFSKDTIED